MTKRPLSEFTTIQPEDAELLKEFGQNADKDGSGNQSKRLKIIPDADSLKKDSDINSNYPDTDSDRRCR